MSVAIVVNGVTYDYPTTDDPAGWGDAASQTMVAVANQLLPKTGGVYTLTGIVNFGNNPAGALQVGSVRLTPQAAIPSTALTAGQLAMCYTTGGGVGTRTGAPRLVYYDGVSWRFVSDDTVFTG